MKNVDKDFKEKADYDVEYGSQNINTSVASITTRQIIEPIEPEVVMPTIELPNTFRIDAGPFINRPFFVEEVIWSDTDTNGFLLRTSSYKMPRDLITSNETLVQGMKIGSLYRSECELAISTAGTITHAGTILVGLIPPLNIDLDYSVSYSALINTILTGPHAYLHANEATSVKLKVPWYCNTDLDSLDFELPGTGYRNPVLNSAYAGNHATLVFFVLNPLQPSEGSSRSLSIIVEANFRNLDILVPTPRYVKYESQSYVSESFFSNLGTGMLDGAAKYAKTLVGDGIDGLRSVVREYTGLHNPNAPAVHQVNLITPRNRMNNIDTTQFLENLDPYANDVRIVQEPIFNSLEDEMATNFIQKKRQYIGTFRVSVNDPIGLRVFNRPISPYQGGFQGVGVGVPNEGSNNIELLHKLSRAWKGDIKITIQSVMNNKQQVKLRLLQMYNPSIKVADSYPVYRSILQAPSHLMEFSAGGQEQEVILPYLARNEMINCSRDSVTEGLLHGMYYIYVAQNLANSSGSPKDVFFNVYISLEDNFSFFGYSTEAIFTQPSIYLNDSRYEAESLTVMNESQPQDETKPGKFIPSINTRLQPILDMRSLIRRLYPVNSSSLDVPAGSEKFFVFPIGNVYGENGFGYEVNQSPISHVARMYYGKHAGTKFRVSFNLLKGDVKGLSVKISYVPPQYCALLQGTDKALLATSLVTNTPQFNQASAMQFPFNNISIPIESQDRSIFEFVVPNNSIYKFLGGPDKMRVGANGGPKLSIADFGSLMIGVTSEEDITGSFLIEAAASDESRFGFHSIAPVWGNLKKDDSIITSCTGTFNDLDALPPVILNPFMYYTRA